MLRTSIDCCHEEGDRRRPYRSTDRPTVCADGRRPRIDRTTKESRHAAIWSPTESIEGLTAQRRDSRLVGAPHPGSRTSPRGVPLFIRCEKTSLHATDNPQSTFSSDCLEADSDCLEADNDCLEADPWPCVYLFGLPLALKVSVGLTTALQPHSGRWGLG